MNTKTDIIAIEYEAADLWRGESGGFYFNYSWCSRGVLLVPANAKNSTVTRKVKAALGLAGVRHTQLWGDGDEYAARINGSYTGFNWHVAC